MIRKKLESLRTVVKKTIVLIKELKPAKTINIVKIFLFLINLNRNKRRFAISVKKKFVKDLKKFLEANSIQRRGVKSRQNEREKIFWK